MLETDNSTPYFLNLHNGEVAHTLILGMTGSRQKSYLCNFLLQNAQKYAPLTFIFDIGGSFQSLTTIFGGSYLNVGQESRDFTINPFSLAPSKENMQFLFSFFRVLIEGNEQRYRLDFKEERKLWDAIERIYVLEPEQRTVSNFANIIGELKDRLHRWTRGGQYGFLFDNAEDTLSFSRFQTFNFARLGRCAGGAGAAAVLRAASGIERNRRSRRSWRPSRCSCSTRRGSSSRTRRFATTSSRRRRHGASTMPR